MEKVEMGLAIAGAVLGAFINAKGAPAPTAQQAAQGWSQVTPNVHVLVKERSTANVKDVTVKFIDDKKVLVSNEYYDCNEARHKIFVMQMFDNGRLTQTQHEDFPYWEQNNEDDNMIRDVVCR